jgi:hypothetical protein
MGLSLKSFEELVIMMKRVNLIVLILVRGYDLSPPLRLF